MLIDIMSLSTLSCNFNCLRQNCKSCNCTIAFRHDIIQHSHNTSFLTPKRDPLESFEPLPRRTYCVNQFDGLFFHLRYGPGPASFI